MAYATVLLVLAVIVIFFLLLAVNLVIYYVFDFSKADFYSFVLIY